MGASKAPARSVQCCSLGDREKPPSPILAARTPDEQRRLFERHIAPLFDYKSIKMLSKSPVSLYALGIPPAQYDELVATGDPIAVLRERVRET